MPGDAVQGRALAKGVIYMIDLRIPEISATAGALNDGIVLGKVNQSLLTNVISNIVTAGIIYAYRRDSSASGYNFIDVSADAVSEIDNSFAPFGETTTFSANDALYISCDRSIKDIYAQITTPGVYTGSIEIYDSTDGKTANRQLTIADGTNNFKNTAGIYKIAIEHPATESVSFSPIPGEVPERNWLMIKLKNFTSPTTSPKLRRMWLTHHDHDIEYTDVTSVVNGAWSNNSFATANDTYFYTDTTTTYYAFPFLAYGMDINMYRRVPDVVDRVKEYLAADGTWKQLQNVSDGTNDYENGPAILGTTGQEYAIRWSIPSDWDLKTLSFAMGDSTTKIVTGYFMRHRATTAKSYGPVNSLLLRGRGRVFGADNSDGFMKFLSARALGRVCVSQIGVPSSTAVTIQLTNINTGLGASFTVPANSIGPVFLDLSPQLAVNVDDEILLAHVSGGSLTDVALHIHWD